MSWAVLRAALDMLLQSEHPRRRVFFVGGEPLLAFALIRRAVGYVERRRRRATPVSYEISTNGLLLGRREARFFEATRFCVQVSFDGVRPAQEARAPGTFEKVDRLLETVRTNYPALFSALRVNLTVTPDSIPHLADSVQYLLGKGVRAITASPSLNGSSRWSPALEAALDRQVARVFDACRRHYETTGCVPFRALASGSRAAGSGRLCSFGSGQTLTVDVDGTLTGCVMTARSYQHFRATRLGRAFRGLQIGHITDPDLSRRLQTYRGRFEATGLFDGRHRKYSSHGRCATCRYLAECTVCPASIVLGATTDDPDRVPDLVCAFNRVSAKYRARFARLESPGGARLPAGVPQGLAEVIVRHLTALARGPQRRRTSKQS